MQLVGWPVVWVGFSGKVMTTAETCTQAQQVQFPQGCVQICHCRLLCVALSENGVWRLNIVLALSHDLVGTQVFTSVSHHQFNRILSKQPDHDFSAGGTRWK